MRFGTAVIRGREQAAVNIGGKVVPVAALNRKLCLRLPTDVQVLIERGEVEALRDAVARLDPKDVRGVRGARILAPYRRPPKILGIGLNYQEHARDLDVGVPDEPASFYKPYTTINGPGDEIRLPSQSQRVTAEAELGVVIGRRCRDLRSGEGRDAIAGFVPLIDMTAEDILRRNPRFLTRAKSFDTFLSVGPWIVTPDEIEGLASLRVETALNGKVVATNVVANMAFPPEYLVRFYSQVMTWLPGDLLCTGTPGAAVISSGDVAACRITGFEELSNPVAAAAPVVGGGSGPAGQADDDEEGWDEEGCCIDM